VPQFKLEVRSHHFLITAVQHPAYEHIRQFAYQFIQWGFARQHGQNRRVKLKMFCASNRDRTEFRFHINALESFFTFMRDKGFSDFSTEYADITLGLPAVFNLRPTFTPYDYQEPIIDYCIQTPPKSFRQKQIPLQTGKGKGIVALKSMEILGRRVCVVIKPMYIEKWVAEIAEKLDTTPERIMVVQGSKHLKALTQMAEAGTLDVDAIIIANATYAKYITRYEDEGWAALYIDGYKCPPDKFFEFIGCGVRIIDEVHQDFHFNFKLDLYTHINMGISLSGTLLSDDPFIARMQDMAYPPKQRCETGELDRYIAATAVLYATKNQRNIKCIDYATKRYSHVLFEQSVIKHNDILNRYFDLLIKNIKQGYLEEGFYKKGDKLLIFVATKSLAGIFAARLQQAFRTLDVRRYIGEDEFENVIDAEICVSTVLSAGTAIDIPGLTTVILTTAINSIQSNIQSLGRLRALKDGRTPRFYYWCCETIPKHCDYHHRKEEMLRERAKSYRSVLSGVVI
jgi:hypothetical protein